MTPRKVALADGFIDLKNPTGKKSFFDLILDKVNLYSGSKLDHIDDKMGQSMSACRFPRSTYE